MSFADRATISEAHELAIIERFNSVGWTANRFGQALLPEAQRDVLKRYRDDYFNPTLLRWFPDILATCVIQSRALCNLIDAKTCGEHQRNYSIEKSAVEAADLLVREFRIPTFFVFDDWRVLTPRVILQRGFDGPQSGNGSGTPYFLIERRYGELFDRIFPCIKTREETQK